MSLKVMVVDDEPQVLEVVRSMMEPTGSEVVTFLDSREAAQCLESQKFDGLVVDARMPHLDGFELTRRVRASPLNGEVPIVMLTGLDDVETMRRAFQAGITFFLGKPFSQDRAWSLFNAMRGAMLKEKRRYARLPVRTAVFCRWGDYGEKEFRGDSLNLSEGGLLIESAGGVKVGQEVELEFIVPLVMRLIRPRARVLRVEHPDRIAVEFTALESGDRDAIQQYINYGIRD